MLELEPLAYSRLTLMGCHFFGTAIMVAVFQMIVISPVTKVSLNK